MKVNFSTDYWGSFEIEAPGVPFSERTILRGYLRGMSGVAFSLSAMTLEMIIDTSLLKRSYASSGPTSKLLYPSLLIYYQQTGRLISESLRTEQGKQPRLLPNYGV